MKHVDLWLPEPVTIDDGEVLLMEDMNRQLLAMVEQLIEDYGDV